jgi:hypothetical protein
MNIEFYSCFCLTDFGLRLESFGWYKVDDLSHPYLNYFLFPPRSRLGGEDAFGLCRLDMVVGEDGARLCPCLGQGAGQADFLGLEAAGRDLVDVVAAGEATERCHFLALLVGKDAMVDAGGTIESIE